VTSASAVPEKHICARQELRWKHSVLLSVINTLDPYHVCYGVGRCVKMGVVFRPASSESQHESQCPWVSVDPDRTRFGV